MVADCTHDVCLLGHGCPAAAWPTPAYCRPGGGKLAADGVLPAAAPAENRYSGSEPSSSWHYRKMTESSTMKSSTMKSSSESKATMQSSNRAGSDNTTPAPPRDITRSAYHARPWLYRRRRRPQ